MWFASPLKVSVLFPNIFVKLFAVMFWSSAFATPGAGAFNVATGGGAVEFNVATSPGLHAMLF